MKKIMAAVCSFVLAMGLVACSGASSSSSSEVATQESGAPTATSVASTGTATGDTVAKIKEKGKLVVLTNPEFPPYEYLGEGGVTAGVDIDLCQQIADELGVELEVQSMDFDSLIFALQSGSGDIVASGVSITEERKKQVDFTDPYVDTILNIVVKDGDTSIASVDDLNGKKIAVQEGTTSDLITSDMDVAEVLRFKTSADAATALKSGTVDAVVMDDLTAENVSQAVGGLTILEGIEVSHEQYAMAVAKGSEDLVAVMNTVLGKAKESGQVEELISLHMEKAKG